MRILPLLPCLLLFTGCTTALPPLKTAEKVDLVRFMGPWYVIAAIPTFIETEAFNAIEEYRLEADGTIATTFTFNKGGFDGPPKRYKPRGFIVDRVNNSTWAMQFVWPLKSEFLITHLDPDYSQTVIGRNKRDYVWIMARTPQIPEADYQRLLQELSNQGYDLARLRKVPQQWPEPR